MVEVGDIVLTLIEEERLGGGVDLHPRPSIVTDLSPDQDIAGLWVMGPQQMEYRSRVFRCIGDLMRNRWITKEEWVER
jgi:hypothetical protein